MFNMTGSEIVVILLLALVVLGPEKLPEAIRKFGRAYGELKKMSSGFQSEFKAALDEPAREMRNTTDMLTSALSFDSAAPPQRPAVPEVAPTDAATTQPPASDPPASDPPAPEAPASNVVTAPGESAIEQAASAAASAETSAAIRADEPTSDPEAQ